MRQYLQDSKLNNHMLESMGGKVSEEVGAVVGGALIRVIAPSKQADWKPTAHNHMFIFLDVRGCPLLAPAFVVMVVYPARRRIASTASSVGGSGETSLTSTSTTR